MLSPMSSLFGVTLGKPVERKPTGLMARARPLLPEQSAGGGGRGPGSDSPETSSQVDGGDRERQHLTREGRDPRGGGMKPTLPG